MSNRAYPRLIADILVACLGPAVGVFGKYERVEKADATEADVGAGSVTESGLAILRLASTPVTLRKLAQHTGARHRSFFKKRHLDPLLAAGFLALTIPDKPRSRFQKYVTTAAGREWVRKS